MNLQKSILVLLFVISSQLFGDNSANQNQFLPLKIIPGQKIWAVHKNSLNSAKFSEQLTGTISSPEFKVTTDKITFKLCGWDGHPVKKKQNFVCLKDAKTKKILKQTFAPGNDTLQSFSWDTSKLIGKKVVFEVHDGISDGGYAWIGVNNINAGKDFNVNFKEKNIPKNWKVVTQGQEKIENVLGIPFYLLKPAESAFAENEDIEIDCNIKADKIFLLGLINSVDQGQPLWAPPNYSNRFFIGDVIGTILINYQDGTTDEVPLKLGYTAWWYSCANGTEPYKSDAKARKIRDEVLKVKFVNRPNGQANLLVLKPQPKKIKSLVLKNNKAKVGYPLLTGITFEKNVAGISNFELTNIHIVSTKKFDEKKIEKELDKLRSTIYTCDADFENIEPYKIPKDFKGPKINFSGSVFADVITRIYYASTHDMDAKIDDDGVFHTSTKNAAQFGMYTGFGPWFLGHGSYNKDAWSRDAGRVLMEVGEFGYDKQMLASCDWFNKKLMWYPAQFPGTNINGKPLPGHWVQNANKPGAHRVVPMPTGFGNLENDGHGLMMMAQYKGWLADGKTKKYLENSWTNFNEAAEYICWLFDNPDISKAKENRLFSDTEGEISHYSLYCDFPCYLGMLGYAEMAEAIGKTNSAKRWRKYAAKLEDGFNNYYPKNDATYGDIWDAKKAADWRYEHSSLAPVILWADIHSFDMKEMPKDWLERSKRTYKRQIKQCVPEYASGVSMGYGHGFITQGALLLDEMKDSAELINWTAKLTYFKGYKPYIIPESCEVDETGKWWHRTGDLGNAVQEAENLKSIRLMVGVEDLDAEKIRILPRLPRDFTKLEVEKYPIMVSRNGKIKKEFIKFLSYERSPKKDIFKISLEDKLKSLAIRLGPYPLKTKEVKVRINGGKEFLKKTFTSGDSRWIWIKDLSTEKKYEIIVRSSSSCPK